MRTQIKRRVAHSGVDGVGILVQAVLGVLLLPLYRRYLTRADHGSTETVVAVSLLAVVLGGGITSAFFRFYFPIRRPRVAVAGGQDVSLVHDGDRDARFARRHRRPNFVFRDMTPVAIIDWDGTKPSSRRDNLGGFV